jgi:hypothetical protein
VSPPKRQPDASSTTPWWLAPASPADEKPWNLDTGLDDLDAEERAIRQRRLDDWRRMRKTKIAHARRVLEDAGSTPKQKHEAKILIGTYAVDPQLMITSGSGSAYHANQGMAAPANRHPKTPPPPPHQSAHLTGIRSAIRRLIKRNGR